MMTEGLSLIYFLGKKQKGQISDSPISQRYHKIVFKTEGRATHETSNSFNQFEYVCASSPGGPGLNFGELSAGRSILGTIPSTKSALGVLSSAIHPILVRMQPNKHIASK